MARWCVVVAAAVLAVLLIPGRAVAHPTLLFTTPAVDTAEADSPTTLVLVFTEPVTVGRDALIVIDNAGAATNVDRITTGRGGMTLTGHLTRRLAPGVYTVRWRATGPDGDLAESTFRFAVGAAITGGAGAAGAAAGTSWPMAGLRWLLFAGLALALGGVVGGRITTAARAVRASLPPVPVWAGIGAGVGLAATTGLGAVLLADVGAGAAVRSTPGRVLAVQAVAFAVAWGLSRSRWRGWRWLPLLTVGVAEGWRSHAEQATPGLGGVSTAVHVVAAAVWVGALVHVVRAGITWRDQAVAIRWALTGYARWALWLFATVVATGTVSALLLVPLSTLSSTGYGRWLLVKLALVTAAAVAALTARAWLRHDNRLTGLVAATRVEIAALAVVLAVTGVLVSTPTPREAAPAAAPPPLGVVLPLATLAGQVGVAVAASQGQLVVRLSTPRLGDYYAPAPAQTYRLAATVITVGRPERAVATRGCGTGCYVGEITWGEGDNLLTLAVAAPGWPAGTVSLLMPWPVTPAPARLTRALTALRATKQLTVYEAVTSDTTAGSGEVIALAMSGAQFAATEPYSAGVAPQVVQTTTGGGLTTLALGFPADGRYVQMILNDADQIVAETVTDAKHVTHRRFVYPEPAHE